MPAPLPSALRQPARAWSPVTVDLDTVDMPLLTQLLKLTAGHQPQLRIECGTLKRLRTLGVCEVVSQLVLLRRAGATICLHSVSPALHRALRLLRLDALFVLAG